MLKQNALLNGIKTQFFTKSTQVNYIKEAKTKLMFNFKLTENEVANMVKILNNDGKYQELHTVCGIDDFGNNTFVIKRLPGRLRILQKDFLTNNLNFDISSTILGSLSLPKFCSNGFSLARVKELIRISVINGKIFIIKFTITS